MNPRTFILAGLTLGLWAAMPSAARAVLANAWHIPDNASDLSSTNMRSPQFDFGHNAIVTVYSGVQKFNNPGYGTANQTGGILFYKGATQGSWSSVPLSFYLNGGPSPNNQYWRASFSTAGLGTNEVIQYYLYLTFDAGPENTYLYGRDSGSFTTASQATAAANPFTVRNRPAWIFHANNRVVLPGTTPGTRNVQFWTKVGYIGKDGSPTSCWADQARMYYTTDGSTPVGALGHGSNTTQVVALGWHHAEPDPSPAGNAMWWMGAVSNLPVATTIRYKIGLWHSSNLEEKFADYRAATPNATFTFSLGGTPGDPELTVNGVNADYTTTRVFVDEVGGDAVPLHILFYPNARNLTNVEVFSNLNRRDRAGLDANGDGIEDGILPPDGATVLAGDDNHYYKAYPMSPTETPGQYALTLLAQKTGAYRLTARYRVAGNTNWFWYSSAGRRDHAVVISPKRARDIVLYELNTLTVEAQGPSFADRSTFADLHDGPGARPYHAATARFNLDYLAGLGVNWLWFQPIHPPGIEGRQIDPNTGQPYELGSPYAVKNFFAVNPLMSKANTCAAALTEFTNFVAAADAAGLGIMLDAAFNHTAHDCELAERGVAYFAAPGNPGNWQPGDKIKDRQAAFYSRSGDYCQRAFNAASVAVAPDRGDFGKWDDVIDVFFGRYAALVCQNPADNGNYLNEGDWFNYDPVTGNFDAVTRNVWRYFADYVLYWLDQTGCPAGTPPDHMHPGIDGLRADFGQGLPPQAWEYLINKARTRKWDFVFMSESLDGGAVTYRSNRHFDLLNENIVFALKTASTASDYRALFEERRAAYGQGLVLLNTTSHDEENYDDPWQAFIRYAVGATVDGAPMIFYGQELGISRAFGFDRYEINFGKLIPHFKKYNSLQPILHPGNRNFGLDQLYPGYAAVNQARQFSRALRGSNRYFLNQTGGGAHPQIYSVAKYETAHASPNQADVVFAFVNLDRNQNPAGTFNVNIAPNGANLFGIKPARLYNVKNIAAYTMLDANRRHVWLWGAGIAGSNVLGNGVYVALNRVPTNDAAWATAPFEAQYLKLYDVTPPPAPPAPTSPKPYAVGNVATFTWPAVSDPEGGISGYRVWVGTTPGASNVFSGTVSGTAITATNAVGNTLTLYARLLAINHAGIEGPPSPVSSGVVLLNPAGDADGDGMSNAAEDLAGTNPLDPASVLKILSLSTGKLLTWASVPGRSYRVLATPAIGTALVPVSDWLTATSGTASWFDPTATNATRFYRVEVQP